MDMSVGSVEENPNEIKPKMHFTGTVVKTSLAGAIVDLGNGARGVLHVSQMTSAAADQPVKRPKHPLAGAYLPPEMDFLRRGVGARGRRSSSPCRPGSWRSRCPASLPEGVRLVPPIAPSVRWRPLGGRKAGVQPDVGFDENSPGGQVAHAKEVCMPTTAMVLFLTLSGAGAEGRLRQRPGHRRGGRRTRSSW